MDVAGTTGSARVAGASFREWLGVRVAGLKSDARAWIARRGFELWVLVGVWMVVSLLIFWLSTGHESPRRYQDEFLFWAVAKSFAAGDGLTWRGEGIGLYYFLYPVLLAPAFWIGGSVAESYTLVHLINSLMIVGVIFPAYLLARLFVGRAWSALAALLAVSLPAVNYAGVIGTESLGYPVATAAFGAMILSIARPRRRNWILALIAIGLAVLTRAQFAVLAPAYFVALMLAGRMRAPEERRAYFRVQREPLALLLAAFVLVGVAFLVRGKRAVGLYAGVFEGVTPSFDDVAYWVKALAADVYLVTGVLPVIATLAMLPGRSNRRDPLVGALLAVTVVATLAFIAQVGWFSAINPYNWRDRHIFYERYMFYLAPLFFTGFVVAWRRVSIGSALLSSGVAVLIVSGFQTDAVLVPFSYDSFGLTLVGQFMESHARRAGEIGSFLAGVTALAAALYCVSRLEGSRIARLLGVASITLVVGVLIWGQAQTWRLARNYSHDAFSGVPKPADFIDKNTDRDVGMIITETDSPEMYFTAEFWNERIVRAFATDSPPIQTPIMYSPRCAFDWTRSGEILGTGCDKVPTAYYLRSDTVSMHLRDEIKRVHPTPEQVGLTLMVGRPPARILSFVDGRNVYNGEVQNAMTVRTFLAGAGRLRVTFARAKRAFVARAGRDGSTLVREGETGVLTAHLPAGEHELSISLRSPTGVPEIATVDDVEVRERGGGWISIR